MFRSVLRISSLTSLATVALLLQSCGYSLSHRVKPEFRSGGIYVPVFENLTDEVGAERVFTNAVVRELQSRGEVEITSEDKAVYTLRGVVRTISYVPSALSPTGFKGLQSYRRLPTDLVVTAGVTLILVKRDTEVPVWRGSYSSFRRIAAPAGVPAPVGRTFDYEAPSSIGLATQSLVESRYGDIARDITRDMYDEMVALF